MGAPDGPVFLEQFGLPADQLRPAGVVGREPGEGTLEADEFTPGGVGRVGGLAEEVGENQPRPVVPVPGEDRFQKRVFLGGRRHRAVPGDVTIPGLYPVASGDARGTAGPPQ